MQHITKRFNKANILWCLKPYRRYVEREEKAPISEKERFLSKRGLHINKIAIKPKRNALKCT